MNEDVQIREATLEDIRAFYGKEPPVSVMAWVAVWRGRVACIAGIAFEPYGDVAFSDTVPDLDAPPITIWRTAKRMFDAMTAAGFPLIVPINRHKDKSSRFLESMGLRLSNEDQEGNALYEIRKFDMRKSSIAELEAAPNIHALLDEYAAECALKGLPHPAARAETYKNIEKTGMLHVFAAFLDGLVIGYITVLYSNLPHYEIPIAVSESYFVSKAYRNTGAGLALRRATEKLAEELGSPALLMSALTGSVLAEILEKSHDYEDANRVFIKRFRHV